MNYPKTFSYWLVSLTKIADDMTNEGSIDRMIDVADQSSYKQASILRKNMRVLDLDGLFKMMSARRSGLLVYWRTPDETQIGVWHDWASERAKIPLVDDQRNLVTWRTVKLCVSGSLSCARSSEGILTPKLTI